MSAIAFYYNFPESVSMANVEETLLMSVIAAEGIHGRAKVRLDAHFEMDKAARTCQVNADNGVGRDICRVFTEFLNLEIGEDAFEVHASGGEGELDAAKSSRGAR